MRIFLFCFFLLTFSCYAQKITTPYLDSNLSVNKRVDDLMSRMTLYEKACQLNQFVGIEHMKKAEKKLSSDDMKKVMLKVFIKKHRQKTSRR